MSSAREEILKLTAERLQNKVESIMLSVNLLLTHPESSSTIVVDEMEKMMKELAIAESASAHAKNLYTQCLALRLREVSEKIENKTQAHGE
jgi:hypothetical protein